ncbi:glutamate racemase [Spongiivirga citrea]|uniref:Glutamate racemase n=1 Tax=Spongiivirga citrea TaxID=1481457 RepID=A0A6M0CJM5_9FLAO|nr:glutamate racemase [Spongiivirga citrea]NER18145.1 glutamate racemase [Spongiivirga citrea]
MSKAPLGFFDSGVGGTSVWSEVITLLPNENSIYLADSKNAPYGPKGKDRIIELSIKNTELLLEKGCKLIAVPCNTATTNAIDILREMYNVPFIGIEPAIKPAALATKTNAVGVLATKGTLTSALFHKTSSLHASGIKVIERVGEGLVPLVEAGKINDKETIELLEKYTEPMLQANIDYLVLGCSHYPYLIEPLRKILPDHITIIDSGEAVARQVQAVLAEHGLLNDSSKAGVHHFYTNTTTDTLKQLLPEQKNISYLDF